MEFFKDASIAPSSEASVDRIPIPVDFRKAFGHPDQSAEKGPAGFGVTIRLETFGCSISTGKSVFGMSQKSNNFNPEAVPKFAHLLEKIRATREHC